AVTIAFTQSQAFGFTMIRQEVRNDAEALTLVLTAGCLLMTVTALRHRAVPHLRRIVLAIVIMPIAWVVLATKWSRASMIEREALDGWFAAIYIPAGFVVVFTLIALVALPDRWARRMAWLGLAGCAVLLLGWAYLVAQRLGVAELARLRMLSNNAGRISLAAAPLTAVLLCKPDKPE
ncbi:MAG: hypothetical protein AAF656_00930, partial [Planctomycetota bacterium]